MGFDRSSSSTEVGGGPASLVVAALTFTSAWALSEEGSAAHLCPALHIILLAP